MPSRFTTHKGPTCTVGSRKATHQAYDRRRYEDEKLGPAARFRSTQRWKRVREQHVAKNPTCADPFREHEQERGASVPCECVHHVIPLIETLVLGCEGENLRSLCWRCHNRVEALYLRDRDASVRLFLSVEEEKNLIAKIGDAWRETLTREKGEACIQGANTGVREERRIHPTTTRSGKENDMQATHPMGVYHIPKGDIRSET